MATIFEKIIKGEIPSVKLYEDDQCLVILDINPVEKGHALVISKHPYPVFTDCPDKELEHLMSVAKKVDLKLRKELGADGTNILINNGSDAGQAIPHLHIHVIPRFKGDGHEFSFKKKEYSDGEIEKMGEKLCLK